ncbi:hypothetical protein FOY91_10345 [Sphingomonas solaris]|uniref:Uncharacterized protein n=1 Tax=Alterirhizorhabdus solaris TaxID=2529389 RepID=A0A558R4E1_9SPHN|nr:hypothetical protein FOY91_10345 [Sphingomonas solaris]
MPIVTLLLASAGCGGGGARPVAAAAVSDGIPLGALPRQALGTGQCGLFLWKPGAGARLVLMAKSGPPPFARLILDGRTLDLPRLGGDAPADATADVTPRYGDGQTTAALDLTIEPRRGLSDGAVAHGSLRIERAGGEGFVVPVSGLLGCG